MSNTLDQEQSKTKNPTAGEKEKEAQTTVSINVNEQELRRDEICETRVEIYNTHLRELEKTRSNIIKKLFKQVLVSIDKILPFFSSNKAKRRNEIDLTRREQGDSKERSKEYN